MIIIIQVCFALEREFMKGFHAFKGEDSLGARKRGWEPLFL